MKVKNYGDMLAKSKNKKLVSFTMFGSYQGEWVGLLEDEDKYELWRGYYGSCSGCDFLESAGNYLWEDDSNYEITKEKAEEYFKEETPFLVIEKEVADKLTEKEWLSILPAKVIKDIWSFDIGEFYKDFKERNLGN